MLSAPRYIRRSVSMRTMTARKKKGKPEGEGEGSEVHVQETLLLEG